MFFTIIISFLNLFFTGEKTNMIIPSIFSDNMVLQQKSDVPFWGKAEPGLPVSIKTSWGEEEETKVSNDGNFLLKVETPEAGGPFTVDLQIGDSLIHYKNVLTGEVWLCSGQSNMEMPLMGWPPNDIIYNSEYEIKNANYPQIRLATVAKAFSNERQFNCEAAWVECTPKNVELFSAAAYFFGKRLHKELNVPVGLIHSSWGGTPVEAWMSEEYLKEFAQYKELLGKLKGSTAEIKAYKEWLESHQSIDVRTKDAAVKFKDLDFYDTKCSLIDCNDYSWPEMTLPALWEYTPFGNFDGVMWFRNTVVLKENLVDKDLVLSLGPIDDIDRTYVNGVLVGGYEEDGNYQTERIYKIPYDIVSRGGGKIVTIAVRVIDMRGGGGIFGAPEKMQLNAADGKGGISLAGNWRYMPVAEYKNDIFYLFDPDKNEFAGRPHMSIDLSAVTPTALYNAMINPLIPFAIKGAIWYQGESNADNPELYASLFPAMINNWRSNWGLEDFPFYYVQISPYNYGTVTRSERLREAQLKTMTVKNTGMIVTMDIGDINNIHPANKKDVGERLANYALAKDYDKDVPFSGPVFKSMKIEQNKIELEFEFAEFMHIKTDRGKNNFTIAGDDGKFFDAEIEIKDDKIYVYHPFISEPKAVRYAWSNTAAATLFNGYGLPASSFRTDNWDIP